MTRKRFVIARKTGVHDATGEVVHVPENVSEPTAASSAVIAFKGRQVNTGG
ncbi:hypothetical protein DSM25558_3923 [Agrobacterium sp. DSM 25558]|nr:hypothetical protein DSM25558_3923 [Agrobacterium sp. DSM 25558]